MTVRVPQHALRLMPQLASQVARYGLRRGLAQVASKVNPALLVLEAATSIVQALDSYLQYRGAIAHRDGLMKLLPAEEKKLCLEREQLQEALKRARADMDQRHQIQQRLGQLVKACADAVNHTWNELDAIRHADLPDLDAFEALSDRLDEAWQRFQSALANYQQTSN